MDSPGKSGVAAALLAVASSLADQYGAVIFFALAGSMCALASANTPTRWDGAKLLARLVVTAAALTGVVAWLLEQHAGLPASKGAVPVAFLIGYVGDRWSEIRDAVVKRCVSIIGGGQ